MYLLKRLKQFIEINGHIPYIYNAWNSTEIFDICPTITTAQSFASFSSVVVIETKK